MKLLTYILLLRKDAKFLHVDESSGISTTFLVQLNTLYLYDNIQIGTKTTQLYSKTYLTITVLYKLSWFQFEYQNIIEIIVLFVVEIAIVFVMFYQRFFHLYLLLKVLSFILSFPELFNDLELLLDYVTASQITTGFLQSKCLAATYHGN